MSDEARNNWLPEGWTRTNLGDVFPLIYGKGLPKRSREESGSVPVYGSNGIVGYHSEALTRDETVVVGRKGTVGAVHHSPIPCWPIDTTYFLDNKRGNSLRFCYYLLRHLQLASYDRSTAIPGLNRKDYDAIEVGLPDVEQQQRIVAKIEELFSDLDAGVAALERVQANLQRYRASVLKAAVEGRLTQQWRAEYPDVEPADELLQRILTQRKNNWQAAIQKKDKRNQWVNGAMPTKGKYSDPNLNLPDNLPTLPNSWTWTTLDALTYFTVDYRGKTPPTAEEGIPIISAANVHGGEIVANRPRKVSEDTFWRWTVRGMPEPGDLLVTTEAPVAEVALYPSDQTYVLTRRVFACQTAGVDNRFIIHALRSEVAQQYIHRCLRGTTVPRILKPDLLATPIPLPPLSEQHQIADQIEAEYTRNEVVKNMCERGITQSANLRQSILKRAFEGNLLNAETKTAAAG